MLNTKRKLNSNYISSETGLNTKSNMAQSQEYMCKQTRLKSACKQNPCKITFPTQAHNKVPHNPCMLPTRCHAPFWSTRWARHPQILKVFISFHTWTGSNPPNIFSSVMDLLSLNLHDNTLPFLSHVQRQLRRRYHLYYYWAIIWHYTEGGNWAS